VCGQRFTTFERAGGATLVVAKRSGQREPFDREKVVAGVRAACKNRPVDEAQVERLAGEVEEIAKAAGSEVSSQQLGVAVLDRLRELDHVAYLRFASVYKGFEDAGDFAREAGLLTKRTAPKRHSRPKAGTSVAGSDPAPGDRHRAPRAPGAAEER